MEVAQVSTPASAGGVPPPVGVGRTGTVRELAAEDGYATGRQPTVKMIVDGVIQAELVIIYNTI
jgi:hypothetical protein